MRLSSTMTRLALNRIARAKGAETRLATPLWAGKSSATATASARGQQGAAAHGAIARFCDKISATETSTKVLDGHRVEFQLRGFSERIGPAKQPPILSNDENPYFERVYLRYASFGGIAAYEILSEVRV